MKNFSIYLVAMLLSLGMLSSCVTTKTDVGTYREAQGTPYTYAKGKQLWLFWGLMPVGRTNVNTPSSGECQVITRYNVTDVLISSLTGGIVMSYTIKVKAKRTE